ncbi:MAG: PSD1 and planctomycete cytochrome C domain-containing protein [Planctomycetota bacterium]
MTDPTFERVKSDVIARAIFLTMLLGSFFAVAEADEAIVFNRDIRPILSDNCFYCHGFDEANRKADLRLDTEEAATEYAIVPGEPDESELYRRMLSNDPHEIMPKPETEKRLTQKQIELVRRWIESGAAYQEHWAWKPLPQPSQQRSNSSLQERAAEVDQRLREIWQASGVQPVGRATPRERLRRLSFDLRGIPPSFLDVRAFESDPRDEIFFQFRDRWMNEIEYAEHQAVRWLDLVRWADTSGFVSDEPIASGAYRAWVIRAHADNLPFDQFSRWQLAGDLLDSPSDDQLIASGYNRIVNTNCEAGAIETEQLYKLKGEHVRALGTTWLGMTTGCAECHDHKFDPFSAKDYYSLAAFYDDLVEAGVYTPGDRREPLHYVFPERRDSLADRELAEKIEDLKSQILQATPSDAAEIEASIRQRLSDKKTRSDFVWIPADFPAMRILEGEFEFDERDGKAARLSLAAAEEFRRHHAAELMTGYVTQSQKVDAEKDCWFADVWIDPKNRPQMLGIQVSHGDYGRLGWRTANYETYYWGNDPSGELASEHPWSTPSRVKRLGDLPEASGWVRLRIPFSETIKPVAGQSFEAVGMAWLQCGGSVGWGDSGLELRTDKTTELQLGETAIRKWWERPYNRQTYQSRMQLVAKAFRKNTSDRDSLQSSLVAETIAGCSQSDLIRQLKTLESSLHVARSLRAIPVLVSRTSDQPKVTRVLARGDYQDETGPIVAPAFPEFLRGDLTADPQTRRQAPLTRLQLADFLFEEAGPLVSRVFVNRLWHQFYGRGISETLEDSGTQGDWPSHPDLLDDLAMEFRSSGWDRNHMVRLLTSTEAYQLSSVASEDLRDQDPGNRLHARQGRFRLPAEAIRDSALHAAGVLKRTDRIPVESFFPFQPGAYWSRSDKVMYGSRHMPWRTSEQASQYQRSLYTFWKRQNIHPTMMAFDAPTRQECTAKRNRTNTPGQALALLNDPIFMDAAVSLASRLLNEPQTSDSQRIQHAFRFALQRDASPQESDVLAALLQQQRDQFRAHPDDAKALIANGHAIDVEDHDPPELASWTIVARTVLNLHEFVSRP